MKFQSFCMLSVSYFSTKKLIFFWEIQCLPAKKNLWSPDNFWLWRISHKKGSFISIWFLFFYVCLTKSFACLSYLISFWNNYLGSRIYSSISAPISCSVIIGFSGRTQSCSLQNADSYNFMQTNTSLSNTCLARHKKKIPYFATVARFTIIPPAYTIAIPLYSKPILGKDQHLPCYLPQLSFQNSRIPLSTACRYIDT